MMEEATTTQSSGSKTWIWIIVGVVVLALVAGGMFMLGGKRKGRTSTAGAGQARTSTGRAGAHTAPASSLKYEDILPKEFLESVFGSPVTEYYTSTTVNAVGTTVLQFSFVVKDKAGGSIVLTVDDRNPVTKYDMTLALFRKDPPQGTTITETNSVGLKSFESVTKMAVGEFAMLVFVSSDGKYNPVVSVTTFGESTKNYVREIAKEADSHL